MTTRQLFLTVIKQAARGYKGIHQGYMYWITNVCILVQPTQCTQLQDHTIPGLQLLEVKKPLYEYHPRSLTQIWYTFGPMDKQLMGTAQASLFVTPQGQLYWVSHKDTNHYDILGQSLGTHKELHSRRYGFTVPYRAQQASVQLGTYGNTGMPMYIVQDSAGSCLGACMVRYNERSIVLHDGERVLMPAGWDTKSNKFTSMTTLQKGIKQMAIPKKTSDLLKLGKRNTTLRAKDEQPADTAVSQTESPAPVQETGVDVQYNVPQYTGTSTEVQDVKEISDVAQKQTEEKAVAAATDDLESSKPRATRVRKRIVPGLDMDFKRAVEYFGQPVAQDMSAQSVAQQLRDIRDLQIAIARRTANLGLALYQRSKEVDKIKEALKCIKL